MAPDPGKRASARLALIDGLRVAFAGPNTRRGRRPPPLAIVRKPIAPRPAAAPAASQAFLRFMPRPARLAMPVQDLATAPELSGPRPTEAPGFRRRRTILMLGCIAVALVNAAVLGHVLGRDGQINPPEALTWLLAVLLAAWLGFGFISACAGFVASLPRRKAAPRPATAGASRTAVLLPTYNEDPGLVLAAMQSMAEEVAKVGLKDRCDFFLLSDTRDEAVARAEATGVLRLRSRLAGGAQVYYRRRRDNVDRKAGNIGEWVETYGGAYEYMLVLDADSLMSGEALAQLIGEMDADAGLGLLQSVPTIVNAATPFSRLAQFANRLYGPVFARGQQWWSGTEGNYWGHNAILRVAAFAGCARLPHLSGPRPFGGHIMSHDFVEAALLRRAGWAVRMTTTLAGSFEESPPTLLDTAARDRRWCQGNLQHARVLKAAGLHWVSRLHLTCGILAYVAPILWLAVLVSGAVVWPEQKIAPGSQAYDEVVGLFALSLGMLAAPKLMALVLALRSPDLRRGFGGPGRLVVGVLLESVASILTTPVMMVMQSVAVVDVLLGRDSGWSAQHRQGAELSRRAAWRAHGGHVLLGAFGAFGAFLLSKSFLMWTSPVFLSLTLSALLSLHTSRPLSEVAAGTGRIFQIPEDVQPPAVLLRSLELRRIYAEEATIRQRIEGLFRQPAAVYDMAVSSAPAAASTKRELALVA